MEIEGPIYLVVSIFVFGISILVTILAKLEWTRFFIFYFAALIFLIVGLMKIFGGFKIPERHISGNNVKIVDDMRRHTTNQNLHHQPRQQMNAVPNVTQQPYWHNTVTPHSHITNNYQQYNCPRCGNYSVNRYCYFCRANF
jgi:hypothetical protein